MASTDSSANRDSLVNCSWNYITIDDEDFIIKILNNDESSDPFYTVVLSDFVSLWMEELHSSELVTRNTILNPNIEAPVGRLLNHLSSVITSSHATSNKFSIKSRSEDELVIVSQTKLSTLPYKWEFRTKQQSQQMVADYLTFPLIAAVAELHRRQNHLIKIITQKDAQIENYKAEGLVISNGSRAEQTFDVKEFQKSMGESMELDNMVKSSSSTTFGSELQSLFIAVTPKTPFMSRLAKIKREPSTRASLIEVVPDETAELERNSDSQALQIARRNQLEKQLAEEKLKKNNDKSAKRLKF